MTFPFCGISPSVEFEAFYSLHSIYTELCLVVIALMSDTFIGKDTKLSEVGVRSIDLGIMLFAPGRV